MRLGINAYRLKGKRTGVGRYIEYMVQHWDKMLGPSDCQTVYLRDPLGEYRYSLSDKTRFEVLRPRLTASAWENLVLPLKQPKIDVLFGPSYTMPLVYPGKSVVAIHSLSEGQEGLENWWYRNTWARRYRFSARAADAVIVPSESTKQDVHRHYQIPNDKIVVAPQGADDCFKPSDDAGLLAKTRRHYFGDDRPFILWVGTMAQRRNIPSIIRAFARLKKRENIPHGLLLLGGNPLAIPIPEMSRELGVEDSVRHFDIAFKQHTDIVPIYNAAELFVSASSYEGFSLTLCEAMACGLPVIATNCGGSAEVVGDAGVLVDTPTPEALAEAMWSILSNSHGKTELRAKSLQRARSFTYENTASITLETLMKVANA